MAHGWIIAVKPPRVADKPPATEVFAVAISDREVALRVLVFHEEFDDADVLVAGEATPELLDRFDVKDALAQQLEARVDVTSGARGTSVLVTHATFAKMPDEDFVGKTPL